MQRPALNDSEMASVDAARNRPSGRLLRRDIFGAALPDPAGAPPLAEPELYIWMHLSVRSRSVRAYATAPQGPAMPGELSTTMS